MPDFAQESPGEAGVYRGEDEYRWLNRKANSIGCTLFSFIIASHDQCLRWLDTQVTAEPSPESPPNRAKNHRIGREVRKLPCVRYR